MGRDSLSQDEIEALLKSLNDQPARATAPVLSPENEQNLGHLGQQLFRGAGEVLSPLLGQATDFIGPQVTGTTQRLLADRVGPRPLAAALSLAGPLSGTAYLLMEEADAAAAAGLVLGSPEPPEILGEAEQPVLEEIIGQLCGVVSKNLSELFGSKQAVSLDALARPDLPQENLGAGVLPDDTLIDLAYRWRVGSNIDMQLNLAITEDMAKIAIRLSRGSGRGATASRTPSPAPSRPAEPRVMVQPARFDDLSGEPGARAERGNLDLILDISLYLTVELGRTQMKIKDILALAPGSVVELNRLAGEAVDVLVSGKVIARGEVVVIDENFGVRITDIQSPVERVNSLR